MKIARASIAGVVVVGSLPVHFRGLVPLPSPLFACDVDGSVKGLDVLRTTLVSMDTNTNTNTGHPDWVCLLSDIE